MPKSWRKSKAMKKPNAKSAADLGMLTSNNRNTRDKRFKKINSYKIQPEPMPRVLYTRMKYAKEFSIATGISGTCVGEVFRTNSIYDPDYSTGAGSWTCTGHPEMSTLYGSYLVTGCKVKLAFFNPSGGYIRVGARILSKGNTSVIGLNTRQALEQPNTYLQGVADTGKQRKEFNFFIRPYSQEGLSKLEYFANTTLYACAMNANPTYDNAKLEVFAVDPTGSSASIRGTIQIIYYVQLYERKTLTTSVFP